MAVRSYQVFGLELASFVLDWGQVEEVKSILLAQSQMFTAEHTLVLSNADNRFTPSNTASVFYGRNLQLVPVTLAVDGLILYRGFIRTVTLNHASRTASIVTQNAFTIPANYFVNLTTTGNPAAVIQTILTQAGLGSYIDPISFAGAAGGFSSAGATVSVAYVTTGAVSSASGISGTTALSAIQDISALCSLSCYVQGGLIRLYAYNAYQGSNSGVKYQVTGAQAYDFSTLEYAYQNLSNSVNVGYSTSSNYYQANTASITANGIETNTQFDGTTGNTLAVPNLNSAIYYAQQFLSRASTIRRQGSFTAGVELVQAHIGDRITVAAPNWGTSPIVFEIIETHLKLVSNSVEIVCATV